MEAITKDLRLPHLGIHLFSLLLSFFVLFVLFVSLW